MRYPWLKWSKPLAGTRFDVPALNPDRPRAVVFYHPDRNLGTVVRTKKGDAGPWVVRMQPTATVTGTVVLPDGKPCPNAELTLSITFPPDRHGVAAEPPAEVRFKTDGRQVPSH